MSTEPSALPKLPTDLHRITTIGDSVFAVALTLMAVGMRLPPELIGRHLTFADLLPMLSDMGGIALSFCIASVFWLSYSVHLRRAVRTTVPFMIANLAVLLCIVLLPISTRLLSAGPLSTPSAAVYSANLLAASLALFVFRRQAVLMSLPPGEVPPPTRIPATLGSYYALTLHSCALVAAFYRPYLAVAVWLAAFTTPMVEAWVRRVNARAA
ncbi:MAG: TMEM175 family protein [Burkholderiales bacterium]